MLVRDILQSRPFSAGPVLTAGSRFGSWPASQATSAEEIAFSAFGRSLDAFESHCLGRNSNCRSGRGWRF